MGGEENARLRKGSETLFRLRAENALIPKEQASKYYHSAAEGTVGACLAIEDDLVKSGLSRAQAQNQTSTLLGGRKVKDLMIIMMTILGHGDPLSSKAENQAHSYPERFVSNMS
jgi:hypothetical protein